MGLQRHSGGMLVAHHPEWSLMRLARAAPTGYMRGMSTAIGRVSDLWRYPVKSMRGERVTEVEVTANGVEGDRAYALRDRKSGRV